MEKPSKRNTTITICFDGNLEGYGCITTAAYTDVGTYDSKHVLPTATWQYNQIAWNRRRQEYHLVVKDPALGGTPGGRPASDYVPTKMRVVMTVVPAGGTYTPPPGGASPAADGGAAPDARTGGDTMSGTGGTSGAGGTGGAGTGAAAAPAAAAAAAAPAAAAGPGAAAPPAAAAAPAAAPPAPAVAPVAPAPAAPAAPVAALAAAALPAPAAQRWCRRRRPARATLRPPATRRP